MTKVLEGTWNELAAHARELEGCRLRLTVLDEARTAKNETKPRSLAEALAGRTGQFDLGATNVAKDGKILWQDHIAEKHRMSGEQNR